MKNQSWTVAHLGLNFERWLSTARQRAGGNSAMVCRNDDWPNRRNYASHAAYHLALDGIGGIQGQCRFR